MDSTLVIPLLFPMESQVVDMHDGSLIRVVRQEGEHIGTLRVAYQADAQRFGAIVQFCPLKDAGSANPPPSGNVSFTATGHAGWPMHRLTLEELHAIKRTGDQRVPFVWTVAEG